MRSAQTMTSKPSSPLNLKSTGVLRYLSVSHWLSGVLEPTASIAGSLPRAHGLSAQTVRIPAARGLSLFGWFVPALAAGPSPTIVMLHGWCGNASNLLPAAQTLHQAGYAVLLIESRGHGRSDPDNHSSLPRFAEDLDSAIDWLKAFVSVDAQRIVALGHSVGAAAALLSASRRHDLAAVVSICAFAHPEQLMQRWFAQRNVPYWPLAWLMNRALERTIGARFDAIAPVNTVAKVSCPVLLVHGRQDTVVPVTDAHLIREGGNERNLTLIERDGGHHAFDDVGSVTRDILEFLESVVLAPPIQSTCRTANAAQRVNDAIPMVAAPCAYSMS